MVQVATLTVTILQSAGDTEVQTISEAMAIAIATVTDPFNFLMILAGALFGLLLGAIPGLGGPIGIALLIPVTLSFDPKVGIMLMAATLGGVAFGGSVSAILINTPGDAPNAATLIDGYPLTKQGRAGEALTISAVSSASGALIGIVLFLVLVPVIQPLILTFRSPEFFWLAIFGLITIALATEGSVLKDLIGAGIGLLLAFHGLNPVTGGRRFTWDMLYLLDGIQLIPAVIGLFAVAEMIRLMGRKQTIAERVGVEGGRAAGIRAVLKNPVTILRASMIGWLIGIIPGVGGTVANFVAYFQEKKFATGGQFGEGDVRGVMASESSNDAKDGGTLLPTLALGIPGSASTAVLLSAFVVFGIVPGPVIFQKNLDIVFVIVIALVVSNIVTSTVGILTANYLQRLTEIRITIIAPLILVVALIGSFGFRGNVGDVFLAVLFGLAGFAMIRVGVSRIIVIIALVLGPIAERNFHQSLQAGRGDFMTFFDRLPSLVIITVLVLFVTLPLLRRAADYARAR
jgi:putative tricarboxylic transport membrane protein